MIKFPRPVLFPVAAGSAPGRKELRFGIRKPEQSRRGSSLRRSTGPDRPQRRSPIRQPRRRVFGQLQTWCDGFVSSTEDFLPILPKRAEPDVIPGFCEFVFFRRNFPPPGFPTWVHPGALRTARCSVGLRREFPPATESPCTGSSQPLWQLAPSGGKDVRGDAGNACPGEGPPNQSDGRCVAEASSPGTHCRVGGRVGRLSRCRWSHLSSPTADTVLNDSPWGPGSPRLRTTPASSRRAKSARIHGVSHGEDAAERKTSLSRSTAKPISGHGRPRADSQVRVFHQESTNPEPGSVVDRIELN